jgi:hypothetical protein
VKVGRDVRKKIAQDTDSGAAQSSDTPRRKKATSDDRAA